MFKDKIKACLFDLGRFFYKIFPPKRNPLGLVCDKVKERTVAMKDGVVNRWHSMFAGKGRGAPHAKQELDKNKNNKDV